MSTNSRYRERKYNSTDNDRFTRILSQPVQAWEKKWAPSSRSKSHPIFKWVKSDRTIVFEHDEDDEDDENDEDEEDKDQVMTEAVKDTPQATSEIGSQTQRENEPNLQTSNANITMENNLNQPTGQGSVDNTNIQATNHNSTGLFTTTNQNHDHTTTDNDEEPTHTPKLSDVPDVDPDQIMEDRESNTDDLNDASRHPAFAPHIHPQMTDDGEPIAAFNPTQSSPVITVAETPITTAQEQSITPTIHQNNVLIPADPNQSISTSIHDETLGNPSDQIIHTTAPESIDSTNNITNLETGTTDTNPPAVMESIVTDTIAPSSSTKIAHNDPVDDSKTTTELPAPLTAESTPGIQPSATEDPSPNGAAEAHTETTPAPPA